jgi:hypothetical protein
MNLLLVPFSAESKEMLAQHAKEEALNDKIREAVDILLGSEIGRLDTSIT